MNPTTKAYSGIIILTISWGTIPLIIRTSDIASISLVGIRTFLGTLFLAILLIRKDFNIKELIKHNIRELRKDNISELIKDDIRELIKDNVRELIKDNIKVNTVDSA